MRMAPLIPLRTVLGLALMCAAWPVPRVSAQEGDDSAERKVMERFLTVLEKTPRRGTALDRVYGYHVEHGSLDDLVKRYEDRTKADPADGAAWLLLGPDRGPAGARRIGRGGAPRGRAAPADDPFAPLLPRPGPRPGRPARRTAVDAFERALTRKPLAGRPPGDLPGPGPGPPAGQAVRQGPGGLVPARGDLPRRHPRPRADRRRARRGRPAGPGPGQVREPWPRDVKDEYRKVQFAIEAAELKVRLGRSPDALADFERLLAKLDPGSWLFKEVRRKIEEVFLRGDDLAGLAKYYEGWIARTPDDVDAMARLGKTYAQLGRASDSRTWLDKAVKLAPVAGVTSGWP